MSNEIKAKMKQGLQKCELNEILFPVEVLDNERPANSEYAKVVRGYGDFTIIVPAYETTLDEKGNERIRVVYSLKKAKELDLNYCSHRYALIPNAEIFPPVLKLLDANKINYTDSYLHMNHARFYAEYIIEDHAFKIGETGDDIVKPMLKVQHSYNGLTEYQITFGYYRLICSNGLVIPVSEKSEFNIRINGRHTKAIHASLEKLNEVIKFFLSQGKKPLKNFEILADRWVEKWEDRVIEVMTAANINIIDNKEFDTIDYLGGILAEETKNLMTGGKVNEWLLYNAINQYLNDNTLNIASPKQRTDKESRILNVLLKDAGLF
jgi:hypothetical protein